MQTTQGDNAPRYEWTCQRCSAGNRAGSAVCIECGFSAQFKVRDLPAPEPEDDCAHQILPEKVNAYLWIFFPEILIAACLAIYAPFWSIQRFAQGQATAPLLLLACEAACIWLFVQAWRARSKLLAYSAIAVFIMGFFLASSGCSC